MALPNSLKTERDQLKNTLVQDIEINKPAELKAYDNFKKLYETFEVKHPELKSKIDYNIFEVEKQNRLDFANALKSSITNLPNFEYIQFGMEQGFKFLSIATPLDGVENLKVLNGAVDIPTDTNFKLDNDGNKLLYHLQGKFFFDAIEVPTDVIFFKVGDVVKVLNKEEIVKRDEDGNITKQLLPGIYTVTNIGQN